MSTRNAKKKPAGETVILPLARIGRRAGPERHDESRAVLIAHGEA
jgi:hypothetical protein